MRITFALFAFSLLLLSLASAELQPYKIRSLSAEIEERGRVEALGGELLSLELQIPIPQQRAYQYSSYAGPKIKDNFGNDWALIIKRNLGSSYEFSLISQVSTSSRAISSLPANYELLREQLRFARATDKIESEEFKALAREIVANATTDFEKIALLAIWVNNYLSYDESLAGQENSAKWAYANKRGVCVEYTYLFAALARALGYPTKVISGYAYSPQGWLGHTWNEVYLGEWVPVDPTWLEVGYLDATHIELLSTDNDLTTVKASAYISRPGAKLVLTTGTSFGAASTGVKLLSYETASPIEYELVAPSQRLRNDWESVIYLKLRSPYYNVVKATLAPCIGEKVLEVEKQTQYAILEPNEERVLVWVIKPASSLSKRYIYSCPLALNSFQLGTESVLVKVDPTYIEPNQIKASLDKTLVSQAEPVKVSYELSRARELLVLTHNQSFTLQGPKGEFYLFGKPGLNEVYLYSEGALKKLEFYVAQKERIPALHITTPERVLEGESFQAAVELNTSAQLTLEIRFLNQRSVSKLSPGEHSLAFNLSATEHGPQQLELTLSWNGFQQRELREIYVVQKPSVEVKRTLIYNAGNKTLLELELLTRGQPRNVSVFVDDEPYEEPFEIAVGEHELRITWSDEFNNSYEFRETFFVEPQGSPTPAIPSTESCVSLAILLGVLYGIHRG